MKHFIAEELTDKEFTKRELQKIQITENLLMEKNPDIIGIAIAKLDCGCLFMSGIMPNGSPMKEGTTLFSGYDGTPEEMKRGIMKICKKCMEDKGKLRAERTKMCAISWKNPLPEEEKKRIFRKIFG